MTDLDAGPAQALDLVGQNAIALMAGQRNFERVALGVIRDRAADHQARLAIVERGTDDECRFEIGAGMTAWHFKMDMDDIARLWCIAFAHGAWLNEELHGTEVDFGMSIGRLDGTHELGQGVFLTAYGLKHKTVALNAHFHEVVYSHAQAFQHRGGQAYCCTVSPFAYDSPHVALQCVFWLASA